MRPGPGATAEMTWSVEYELGASKVVYYQHPAGSLSPSDVRLRVPQSSST